MSYLIHFRTWNYVHWSIRVMFRLIFHPNIKHWHENVFWNYLIEWFDVFDSDIYLNWGGKVYQRRNVSGTFLAKLFKTNPTIIALICWTLFENCRNLLGPTPIYLSRVKLCTANFSLRITFFNTIVQIPAKNV